MNRIIFLLLIVTASIVSKAQQKAAYILYNGNGKKISYDKMIKTISEKDVLLFGEFHNNPISHWLQLEVTRDCDEKRELTLGAEMFEHDNQDALDLYLSGATSAKGLDSMARLWNNYQTDYAPLVNYAKENKIKFIATNVPRKYASYVYKGGFAALDTIPTAARAWIAPLPITYDSTLPGYIKMKEMMAGHGGDNLPRAQAIKDATMAHFILQNFIPGNLFIHFNGSYHSENYEGIVWYLKKGKDELRIATITTVSQKDISKLAKEHLHKADYIICVDEDMTTTY